MRNILYYFKTSRSQTFAKKYINIRFGRIYNFLKEMSIAFTGEFFRYSLPFYFHFLLVFRIVAVSTVLRAEPNRAICFPSYICRKSLINRHCVQRRQSKTWSIISGIRLQLAGLIVEHKLSNHTAGLRSVSYHSHSPPLHPAVLSPYIRMLLLLSGVFTHTLKHTITESFRPHFTAINIAITDP